MEEQIKAIQVEIENIYKEISTIDQEEAILKLLPIILEQIKQLPKSQKFIDVPHYKFIKRSLTEIQDKIEDTSSKLMKNFLIEVIKPKKSILITYMLILMEF